MKRLRSEANAEGIEDWVKYPNLIRARGEIGDAELPERISFQRCPRSLDENLGSGEVAAIYAVENNSEDLCLAGPRTVGWVRRGAILRTEGGRKKHDYRHEDSTASDHLDTLRSIFSTICWGSERAAATGMNPLGTGKKKRLARSCPHV